MARKLVSLFLGVGVLVSAASLVAHHSVSAEFDTTKTIKFTGKVTGINWGNPHIYTLVEAPDPANGKTIFTGSAGCGGCHALAAAGTTGAVGPALDDLSGSAQKAGQPLDAFIKTSIVDPSAFVAEGYPDGVMPTNFGSTLSASDIDDLVAFISASQK